MPIRKKVKVGELKYHKGFLKQHLENELFYQFWVPEMEPTASILIIHGLTGHSGRYGELVTTFTNSGYAIFGVDLPGHGRSSGEKVYVDTFKTYVSVIKEAVYRIKRLYPERPLFLLGHSMGGLITTEYLTQEDNQIAGAILSCPSIKTTKPVSRIKYLLSLFLSSVYPTFHIQKLNTNKCKTLCESTDPYVYRGKITARLSVEILKAMKRVLQNAKKISTPLLILQCVNDSLVSPEGATTLFRQISSEDKTLKLYTTQSHEMLSSTDNSSVYSDLRHWLAKHAV